MKASVLSLQLIPLTLAYAIVRYRLMDVDILFRRGYAYTLATLCVLAAFYGIIFSLASLVQKNFQDLGNTGLITVMLAQRSCSSRVRNWIQERLDRYFYRDQYDYRRTLVEFARELSSETDLDTMLHSVADRLMQTLSISHLAFFLRDDRGRGRTLRLPAEDGRGAARPEHAADHARRSAGPEFPHLETRSTVPVLRAYAPSCWTRFQAHGPRRCATRSKISTSPITCRAWRTVARWPIWASAAPRMAIFFRAWTSSCY